MCRETATLSVAPASRREVNYPFAGALRFSHFRKHGHKVTMNIHDHSENVENRSRHTNRFRDLVL